MKRSKPLLERDPGYWRPPANSRHLLPTPQFGPPNLQNQAFSSQAAGSRLPQQQQQTQTRTLYTTPSQRDPQQIPRSTLYANSSYEQNSSFVIENTEPEDLKDMKNKARHQLVVLLSLAVFLILGLCLLWHRTYSFLQNASSSASQDGECSGPHCAQDAFFGSSASHTSYTSSTPSATSTASAPPANSSSAVGLILVITVFGALAWFYGRGNSSNRDTGMAHRVYPPGAYLVATFAPIAAGAALGIAVSAFVGFKGFLGLLFVGVVAALVNIVYMASAPEIAGGGAYVNANGGA